jgi:hypothetical protein
MEIIPYGGWHRNLRLTNGSVELIITLEVGPRILRFGFIGERNIFKEFEEELGGNGEGLFKLRGGHRLWVSPEYDHCYDPDNSPVELEELDPLHVRVWSAEESHGWQRGLEIRLEADKDSVEVTHLLKGTGPVAFPVSPWALSVLAAGGTAVIPQPDLGSHDTDLLPNRTVVLWSYTDLFDSRFNWGRPNLTVAQTRNGMPTKLGLLHTGGWVGYYLDEFLFAKSIAYNPGATYPDRGVNFEMFTNWFMLELESLGPLQTLEPGQTIRHLEQWLLQRKPGFEPDQHNLNRALGLG